MYTGKTFFNLLENLIIAIVYTLYAFTATGTLHDIVVWSVSAFVIVWFLFWLFTRKPKQQ